MKGRLEMKEMIYMLSIPDIKELITPICKQYGIERAYLNPYNEQIRKPALRSWSTSFA